MCGIAGYVCTNEYEKKLDMIFPLMGVFMDDRGGHSWGYTDGINIHKELGELQAGWTPKFLGAKQAAIHTRYGTTGAKTSDNSHPWDFGDGFIGMHNGVVDNHWELNKKYDRKCEVDSQHILLHIKEGRDLSDIEAYGTVVFWRDGKVWLGSFNNGDLAIARTSWGVVFASTSWAIDYALRMAGEPEAVHYNIVQGSLYVIEDGQLYVSSEKLNIGERKVKTTWQQGRGQYTLSDFGIGKPINSTLGCGWCTSDTRELYDTQEGLLCGQCARYATEDWRDFKVEDDDEPADKYTKMTVRQWAQTHEISDLPFDDPCMTSCDNCTQTLLVDDDCFVEVEEKIEFVLCTDCHAQEVLSALKTIRQDVLQ